MTEERAIIELESNAPPPLEPLTHVVISPANIAAEQRHKNAQTLGFMQRVKIRRARARLLRRLASAGYQDVRVNHAALRHELKQLKAAYSQQKQQLLTSGADDSAKTNLAALRRQIEAVLQRYQATESQLRELAPMARQYRLANRALEDHRAAVARNKAQKKLQMLMTKEAKIYETLIIDKWTRLGFAHQYTDKGKTKIDRVKFAEVRITLDAIYYKIDASYQTAFKNWKTNLPDGVYITNQLLNDVTLSELSIACQRQVTGVYSASGAWVIVHRLDSADGLLNYVSFDDVLERYPHQHTDRLPICTGVGLNRQVQWVNLSDFPHWLVGGFTNSGKSNMVNVAICTLITHHKPDDLRLVLIDLKGGLEFDFYSEIPHLHGKVVDTVPAVAATLADLESIMHERFKKFKGIAKRLEEYHAKRPNDRMPRILCVFDEVASIMDNGNITKQILASLRELTRMGRAVGIHIFLCTQRPDVKAIDGAIKANLAVRISGRMITSADSVTILGNSLAKDLAPIPGRMVMQLGPDPLPIQTPHIDQDHIIEALKVACAYPAPAPLDVPEKRVVHQAWTPERVIEFAITHMGGLVSGRRLYDAVQDDHVTAQQMYDLAETVWSMANPTLTHKGIEYRIQKSRGGGKRLVPVEAESS